VKVTFIRSSLLLFRAIWTQIFSPAPCSQIPLVYIPPLTLTERGTKLLSVYFGEQRNGHVTRMGEKRNVNRLLVGKPAGKRPLGRPKRVLGWIVKR
jgi:hypothetical protein